MLWNKIYTTIITLFLMLLVISCAIGQGSFDVSEHPYDTTLKCSKDKILHHNTFEDKKFNPETKEWVDYGEKVRYLYVSDEEVVAIKDEVIAKRTKNIQYVKTGKTIKKKEEWQATVHSGEPFYYDKSDTKWYQTETAYMKKDAFESQTSLTAWDWLFNRIAYAADTIYTGAGDGAVKHYNGDWDTVHDALTGTFADYTSAAVAVGTKYWYSVYDMYRMFLPFDGDDLPEAICVSAAVLSVYVTYVSTWDYGVVLTTQPSNTALTTADFDLCGGYTAGATEGVTRDDLSPGGRRSFTGNSSLFGWIQDAAAANGFIKLGMRDEYDLDDDPQLGNTGLATVYNSEQTGTIEDPKLVVTYTEGACASDRRIMLIH